MQIDIHKIAKLIELVSNSDVSEINLKQGEEELKITREKQVVAQAVQTVVAAPAAPAPSSSSSYRCSKAYEVTNGWYLLPFSKPRSSSIR